MNSYAFFFDFLWKFLVIVTISSGLICGSLLVAQKGIRKISGKLFYRAIQGCVVRVLSIVCLSALMLVTVDKDLQAQCFGSFVQSNDFFGVTRIVSVLWLAVTVVLMTRDFVLYRSFSKHLQRTAVDSGRGYFLTTNLPAMSFGFLQSHVYLPSELSAEGTSFQHILQHEKVHVKNADGFWNVATLVMARLSWFNPMMFFFLRLQKLAVEMRTDEQVLTENSFDVVEYCHTLLNLAAQNQKFAASASCHLAGVEFHQLQKRILNLTQDRSSKLWLKFLSVMMLAVGLLGGLNESFATMKVDTSDSLMCYQVQHEKVIEQWLHMKVDTNKCE